MPIRHFYASIMGAAICGLMLSGCSLVPRIEAAASAVSDFTVPAKAVIIAANAFDGVEATAKNIIILCTPATRPSACNDTQVYSLIKAVRAGRAARDGLEAFLQANPGALGSQGLYAALTGATSTINAAVAAYNGA